MSAPPYMKLYVGDYLADTTHLTRSQHAAYLLLLMAMWRAGGKLPADERKLAQIAMCSPREWAIDRQTVLAFFRQRGAILYHKRLSEELAKYREISGKRKVAGKAGGSASHGKDDGNSTANAKQLPTYIRTRVRTRRTPQAPHGALIEISEWSGPAEVRAIVHHRFPREADAYLTRYCTWREVPDRALVTSSATIHAKLKACEGDLKAAGWSLVLEQERVA